MNFRQLGFSIFLLIPLIVSGQTSAQYNSAEIKLGLKKLNVLGSALYIAAHPDDENTRLLAFLAKEKKYRTGYLSLTRGDGGQNLIGNEQSELLGLIRTQELLAARRTDGAEQFFSRAIDFGFSKNSEETFRIWDKEQILADAVWVIRKFRPDVIITRFPEDARAGHGQHAASAIIAREAFLAAADPKRFPEQLKFVQVWSAKRIVWNTYNFGGLNTTSDDQLKLDVGAFNPLLGKGYGEIAAESRTNHKSQGFGSAKQRGQSFEYFSHTKGISAKADLFENINSNWNRIPGGEEIGKMIGLADKNFNADNPSASVPAMISILKSLEKLPDGYWKELKSKELKDLIAGAAGLWFETYATQPVHSLGDSIKLRSEVLIQSGLPVRFLSVGGKYQSADLKNGFSKSIEGSIIAESITEPYWLKEKHPNGMFMISDQNLVGHPENPAPVLINFSFNIAGKEISYQRPAVFKYTDQVRGEVYQPLIIAPPVTASIADKAYVFTGNTAKLIQIQLKSYRDKNTGTVIPNIPAGWKVEPEKIEFNFAKKGEEKAVQFKITPSDGSISGVFALNIQTSQGNFNRGNRVINYEHIPLQTLFPLAEARIERVDLLTGGKKIGYLTGAGDLIPESLQQIGYQVSILTEAEIMNTDLAQYDAIISGLRAYNVNERLNLMQPKLMDYVNNGGTYLVQYNVNNPLLVQNIGPYPFKISRDRVTEENAAVTFLEKDHPVLNYPNKISQKDFDGWIQERGLYFTTDADAKYSRILSMNDPGEPAKDGSLLVADYGKGRFVYTSLVFFRELPAGIPGAYRLFVNLITKKR
ncbi:N-acetylglucosaminyl deacetylase, LmbE family [Daejeonella rubra]|uniref:N-acetylglucosaminyl deacetylase, LmbE family n=1 Tax=Daejeonella rubra TaxID=990371 RepID=A0A1G9Q5J9_9SPHI|nr:PIG-L family deacetylase [Daejeonella rubra]SDM06276.1 N-acetylglucosaminyl deacetylase, LmbE family [Daejeonella rubra]